MAVATVKGDYQSTNSRLGVLEERVHGIENKLSEISVEISALLKDIQERSKTPWANIISACGVTLTVVTMFGWLALSPIKDNAMDIKERLKVTELLMVTRSEHTARWETYETRHNDLVKRVDKMTDELTNTASSKEVLAERKDRINRIEDRLNDLERRARGPVAP